MKFPSLIKTAKNTRFQFSPRHYDPIKEEIDLKVASEKAENSTEDGVGGSRNPRISEAFQRRDSSSNRTSMVQLIIAFAIFTTFVGWLFFGNDIFYIYLVLSPLYFYFRIRSKNKKKD